MAQRPSAGLLGRLYALAERAQKPSDVLLLRRLRGVVGWPVLRVLHAHFSGGLADGRCAILRGHGLADRLPLDELDGELVLALDRARLEVRAGTGACGDVDDVAVRAALRR